MPYPSSAPLPVLHIKVLPCGTSIADFETAKYHVVVESNVDSDVILHIVHPGSKPAVQSRLDVIAILTNHEEEFNEAVKTICDGFKHLSKYLAFVPASLEAGGMLSLPPNIPWYHGWARDTDLGTIMGTTIEEAIDCSIQTQVFDP
ncbi:hypothetical protein R3P38DRAFT_701961 [Favolaschia claudopus]|uniref:Uncharacterized protein n=1 Tax=Favolaschia claudopus TaxID=2862362 RepID=A0AAW0C8F4_9AGAR